jgi:hypothetical protein
VSLKSIINTIMFISETLYSILRKFYSQHDLVNLNGIYMSHMCRYHFHILVLSSLMIYYRVYSSSNTTGTTSLYFSEHLGFVDRCLFLFFWPSYCQFFFDLRHFITPLISSNCSHHLI